MAGWRPKNAEGKVLEGGLWVPEEMAQQEEAEQEQRTPSLSSSGRPRGVDWTPGELVAGGPSKKRVQAEAKKQAKQNAKQQAGPKEGEVSKSGEARKSGELQGKVDSILGLLQGNVGGLVNQGRGGVPGTSQSPQLQAASNTADQNYNMLTNMVKPHPDQARVAPKRDLSAEADKILADQEVYYSAIGKRADEQRARADEQRAKAEEDRRQREKKDPMAYLGVLQGLLGKK